MRCLPDTVRRLIVLEPRSHRKLEMEEANIITWIQCL